MHASTCSFCSRAPSRPAPPKSSVSKKGHQKKRLRQESKPLPPAPVVPALPGLPRGGGRRGFEGLFNTFPTQHFPCFDLFFLLSCTVHTCSGDKPHVGIARVTLHKTRPIVLIGRVLCKVTPAMPTWDLSPHLRFSKHGPSHTVDYVPFIKSQPPPRNSP